jgi:hypothetical protein
MEWHLNVPKILHVYWGGSTLSYLRFMTIKTFMKYNPDWEVKFLYPKYPFTNITWWNPEQKYDAPCKDFFPDVMELPITKTDIDFKHYGFTNQMSEVHKSDFIRLVQLSTYGGLWSDMDILYFKPMNNLYFNTPENKNIETFYCDHNYGHSVGFLMGSPRNRFFRKLMELSKKEYSPLHYQTMGAIIYKKYFSTPESINDITPAMNISMDVVYAYDATYFSEILMNDKPKFTNESIGMHWFAGSPIWRDFLIQTDGGLNNLPDNIIGNILKKEHGITN